MDLLDDAKESLGEHGVDVEIPATVESHDRPNSKSEFLLRFDMKTGLEAATYKHLDDRIDVYRPLAINRAFHELYEEEPKQLSDALQRNADRFTNRFKWIEKRFDEERVAYQAKLSKFYYEAAIIDDEIDEAVQEKFKDLANQNLLQDIEHELVHASHYQNVIDGSVESLQEDFARYFEDIKHINRELSDNEKRIQQEGISNSIDLKMAAATKFLDENRLQTMVSMAGREHKKWDKKHTGLSALEPASQEEQRRNYAKRTKDLLQSAILREANLQGDFKGFMQQYADRLNQGHQIPGDFTEAYAQFWTAYRNGNLEEGRENIFQKLEGYDIEGLEDTMEDLLDTYDELEGSQEERVTEIMASQMEYLETNYDVEI